MSLTLESLVAEAKELPLVPLSAIMQYQSKIAVLTKRVDDTLSAVSNIDTLIGNSPLQIMYDNHRHHAFFMSAVFSVGNYELLARTIPWVYHAYFSHAFSYDYFPLELSAWVDAVEAEIDADKSVQIKAVYEWMLLRHQDMMAVSKSGEDIVPPINQDWLLHKQRFFEAVITGDHRDCLTIAEALIQKPKDVGDFYLQIIQPVMYEVGALWERGEISVAQEHLASSTVSRIMANIGAFDEVPAVKKGKAVVTAVTNEFHEIGPWMISDVLEQDGWQVRYLGANTPINDLLELLRHFQPDVLALSVTMPFNLTRAKNIIYSVKNELALNQVRIMVGGRVFNEVTDLWQSINADGFAANAKQAKELANSWRHNG